ncbi:hypothetical protein [Levilactobacillus angrenensis]|uniref:Uncharacterized protein n=1 Tax=Levilactobacillus angrenensis TaxID=2486020 RepID=A0ABW1U6M1_9LACO|nr:hypothetical protein [Levilactobacillus angrenensis]
MDMKKIVMAATLLSIVTGGEVSALAAKTTHQSVAKITHVKVTKHKVTGYTTAKVDEAEARGKGFSYGQQERQVHGQGQEQ